MDIYQQPLINCMITLDPHASPVLIFSGHHPSHICSCIVIRRFAKDFPHSRDRRFVNPLYPSSSFPVCFSLYYHGLVSCTTHSLPKLLKTYICPTVYLVLV
ncbi:hypothetical protein M407DRAFT_113635 [Tulasnella calospora MUT 4182]|uniref:Uncharacterized protein n=1 Tax=Tulasnella calospora MUT 4182 TaxID=1051891 RepID=A0A0C3LNV7_9AGAM|nr:hypothetical protein M407DRAFT_113635 [Tulasnella calospora MUT 4182]